MRTVKIVISGVVQGVFFRKTCKQVADEMLISGHAINLHNGDVEVIAQGATELIDKLILWCHKGSPGAEVETVHVEEIDSVKLIGFVTG